MVMPLLYALYHAAMHQPKLTLASPPPPGLTLLDSKKYKLAALKFLGGNPAT